MLKDFYPGGGGTVSIIVPSARLEVAAHSREGLCAWYCLHGSVFVKVTWWEILKAFGWEWRMNRRLLPSNYFFVIIAVFENME